MDRLPSEPPTSDVFCHPDSPPLPSAIPIPQVPPPPLPLSLTHHILFYVDQTGTVQCDLSPSLATTATSLLVLDIRRLIAESLRHKGVFIVDPPSLRKRRRSSTPPIPPSSSPPLPQIQTPAPPSPGPAATNTVPLPIGDTPRVLAYYTSALRAFQQINCRQIAKAFIRIIEPRKQVKHPYNGGRPGLVGEKADPERTKPTWWPAEVVHREPDHLKKPDRITLLIHILRNLRRSHGVDVAQLREAGLDVARQIKPHDRLDILEEIYAVRHQEERFEDGEISANAAVYIVPRDAKAEAPTADVSSERSPSRGNASQDSGHCSSATSHHQKQHRSIPESPRSYNPPSFLTSLDSASTDSTGTVLSTSPSYGFWNDSSVASVNSVGIDSITSMSDPAGSICSGNSVIDASVDESDDLSLPVMSTSAHVDGAVGTDHLIKHGNAVDASIPALPTIPLPGPLPGPLRTSMPGSTPESMATSFHASPSIMTSFDGYAIVPSSASADTVANDAAGPMSATNIAAGMAIADSGPPLSSNTGTAPPASTDGYHPVPPPFLTARPPPLSSQSSSSAPMVEFVPDYASLVLPPQMCPFSPQGQHLLYYQLQEQQNIFYAMEMERQRRNGLADVETEMGAKMSDKYQSCLPADIRPPPPSQTLHRAPTPAPASFGRSTPQAMLNMGPCVPVLPMESVHPIQPLFVQTTSAGHVHGYGHAHSGSGSNSV